MDTSNRPGRCFLTDKTEGKKSRDTDPLNRYCDLHGCATALGFFSLDSYICVNTEVSAGAFFALSRSRARSLKKSAKARQNKGAKAKAPSAKEKARIRFFLLPHLKPIPEPKAALHGEKQGCWAVVGKLLLKSNCVTLLPLLLKETSYFESVTHFFL